MMTACKQDDNTQLTTPIEPIIFSDVEVGQKFLYQRYVVNDCDLLPDGFEWRDDTLVLKVIGLEESRIFLQESLTEYSENYYENTPPHQYPLNITDGGLSLTEVSGSRLFSSYSNDTLRLSPVRDTLVQSGCELSLSFAFPDVAHIPTFELGDVSQTNKLIVGTPGLWGADYLIYDDEKIYTAHSVGYTDVGPPFYTSASGWNLIEE